MDVSLQRFSSRKRDHSISFHVSRRWIRDEQLEEEEDTKSRTNWAEQVLYAGGMSNEHLRTTMEVQASIDIFQRLLAT